MTRIRIIPARAGFTTTTTLATRVRTDHPRSRGVYTQAWDDEAWAAGSSPLARGLRGLPVPGGPGSGIIPARAGFTDADRQTHARCWDHPRSRGVYKCQAHSG